MARKQLAALAALVLISTPSAASDFVQLSSPGVMFYLSMPLDAKAAKKEGLGLGMSLRGTREYQVLNLDTRMFNNFSPLGGIEAKWIIAGVVAAGAAVAVASKDKSTSGGYQQQQQQQAAAQQQAQQQQAQQGGGGTTEPCPVTPSCP